MQNLVTPNSSNKDLEPTVRSSASFAWTSPSTASVFHAAINALAWIVRLKSPRKSPQNAQFAPKSWTKLSRPTEFDQKMP